MTWATPEKNVPETPGAILDYKPGNPFTVFWTNQGEEAD